MRLAFAIFIIHLYGVHSLIVPDDFYELLLVVSSHLPLLKKGTDSRLGWGFRIGDRADFQFLVELGPQTYTQPLANQPEKTNKKRNTNSIAEHIYKRRQRNKYHINKKKNDQINESRQDITISTTSKSDKKLKGN